jgi:hypothetical protein
VDLAHRPALALAELYALRRTYAAGHPRVHTAADDLEEALDEYFARCGESEPYRIDVEEESLSVDGSPVNMSLAARHLAAGLTRRDCCALVIHPEVTAVSWDTFLAWSCDSEDAPAPENVEGLMLVSEGGTAGDRDLFYRRFPEFRLPLRAYRTTGEVLEQAMEDARAGRDLPLDNILHAAFCIADEVTRAPGPAIAPVQVVREELVPHQQTVNVAFLTTALMHSLDPDRQRLARVAQAALLHDIGKSQVPTEVLEKRGAYTPDERLAMERHCELGADLLLDHPQLDPLCVEAAYCHHMRDDGLGYPMPRAQVEPGPVTKLIQVANMFEALTARRPHRRRYTVAEAGRVILETPGMESRRSAASLLLAHVTESPPGSKVILESGERATVLETRADDPRHPLLRVVADESGDWLEEPHVLDLQETPDNGIVKIILKPGLFRY